MKFSILIPAYKATFFKECLDSVLSQTYPDYEVVILNDCSPEPIKEIVSEYHNSKIRYYENEHNVGAIKVVDNWNKLLDLAKGEYVICMGDDDKLTSDCLEKYINSIFHHGEKYDLYHARAAIINQSSEIIDIQEDRPDYESVYSIIWHGFQKGRIGFIGDFLFRKAKLKSVGGFHSFPLALASDWVSCELVAQEKGVINLHSPTFLYRTSKFTITSSGNSRIQADASLLYQEWVKNFLSPVTSNRLDELYRNLTLLNFERHLRLSRSNFAARDMSKCFLPGFIFWFRNRRHYEISNYNFFI